MEISSNPRLILLFCGKRKSGKDFLTDWLQNHEDMKNKAVIIRLSGPLKQCYAENHGLDYSRLLDNTEIFINFISDPPKKNMLVA